MTNFNTIFLLCGLILSVEAMGFFRWPNSQNDDCDCEPGQQNSTTPSKPTTTTPKMTTPTPTTTTPRTTPTTPTTTTSRPTTSTPRMTTPISTVPPTHTVHNCTHGTLFNRVPTAANNYTSVWCIIVYVNITVQNTRNMDVFCKEKYGENATLSLPENAAEMASINQMSKTLWANSDLNGTIPVRYTLVVDGYLCSPINYCNESYSQMFSDSRTDPSFILTQWNAGQPDTRRETGTQKQCLGIDEDNTLRNIFCIGGGNSPFNGTDGKSEYSLHGYVCGAPANVVVFPGDE